MSAQLATGPTLGQIQALQAAAQGIESDPALAPSVEHYFAAGLYGRRMHQAAGTMVVGRLHRVEHFCVLLQGDVTIATPGQPAEHFSAPAVFVTQPGTKRAIIAHTDVQMLTVHAAEETDVAAIEARVIEPELDALDAQGVIS